MNSGAKANKTGRRLETFVENTLKEYNYSEFDPQQKHDFINCKDKLDGKWYAKQAYIGQSIYDTPRHCDFLIFDEKKYNEFLAIECKWQASSGSVDEKYPFLVHNITLSKIQTIILLDGGGYKEGAKKWLQAMVKELTWLCAVYDMKEFHNAVNSGLFLD